VRYQATIVTISLLEPLGM